MANIPRAVSLAVFRVHIENGLSVAFGVGLTGLLVGWAWGFDAAIAAATGAVAVSISDQPDPLSQKPWVLGFALLAACFFTALSSFARFAPGGFLAATAFTGLWTGLVSAYGKRALTLSMTGVLSFVFAMGQHFVTPAEALIHLGLFVAGAVVYTAYAGLFAFLFDDRVRRLLLAEAMRAFADYLRAKAALYNPDAEGPAAFRALIDAHAVLADRLQAARDSLFARRGHPVQRKRIDTLIALLDAFETMLSSDADFELLRRSGRRDIKWRMNALVGLMADEVEGFTLALRSRWAIVAAHRHEAACRDLIEAVARANAEAPEDAASDYAFTVTAYKLALADTNIATLATVLDRDSPPSRLAAGFNLEAFRQPSPRGLEVLWRQFSLDMPAMRYAVRLAMAMSFGLALTQIFPRFAHANWVLLTIALIMRANYSVTRQRRWDRVTGTLLGCAIAVLFINILPAGLLLLAIVLAVGTSHAYGGVKYRVTAVSASVSSLLLLHFAAPLDHPQFFERIVDTLIGAALSWAFSFLLPNWESDDLPRMVRGLLAADAAYAEAALQRMHDRQAYRLARKKTMDAVAQLSGAIRRLADEPNANRRMLAALNELLAANYLLASDFSTMPVMMQVRAGQLDAEEADRQLEAARRRVAALLGPDGGEDSDHPAPERDTMSALAQADPGGNFSMTVLARRLAHIEHAARKVARLAARPVIEENPAQ
jgi:uncharacterized membrane protein YccC